MPRSDPAKTGEMGDCQEHGNGQPGTTEVMRYLMDTGHYTHTCVCASIFRGRARIAR